MKDVYELEKAMNAYCEKHGFSKAIHTKCHPDENYYYLKTMDYDILEGKIVMMKNGKTKTIFKVNGDVTSLYK